MAKEREIQKIKLIKLIAKSARLAAYLFPQKYILFKTPIHLDDIHKTFHFYESLSSEDRDFCSSIVKELEQFSEVALN